MKPVLETTILIYLKLFDFGFWPCTKIVNVRKY